MDVCTGQQLLCGVGVPQGIEGAVLTISAFEQAAVPHESSEGADETVGLLGSAGMAVVDSTFPLYADRALQLSPREIGLMFAVMAGTNALLQALAVAPAMARFGAVGCLRIALSVYAAGCVIVALAGSVAVVMAGLLVLAFAYALFLAPASQLVSNEVGPGDRGAALGLFQGASNIGRFLTPLVSGLMFSSLGASSPFVGAALLMLPALIATGEIRRLAGIR